MHARRSRPKFYEVGKGDGFEKSRGGGRGRRRGRRRGEGEGGDRDGGRAGGSGAAAQEWRWWCGGSEEMGAETCTDESGGEKMMDGSLPVRPRRSGSDVVCVVAVAGEIGRASCRERV